MATHTLPSAEAQLVLDRLMKRYKSTQAALKGILAKDDSQATKGAQDELDALVLFKGDMGTYLRLYTFLSQIFDYGSNAIEKLTMFYKRLLPLLEFGRKRDLLLGTGETIKLAPITEAGSGSVQEKEKVWLNEIIEKVNDLFEGALTDQDKLVYVNNVIKGKLLELAKLQQQATNNTKEQFANSSDLKTELLNAIMGALDARTLMSMHGLDLAKVQKELKDILLNHAYLYETLRSTTTSRFHRPDAKPANP